MRRPGRYLLLLVGLLFLMPLADRTNQAIDANGGGTLVAWFLLTVLVTAVVVLLGLRTVPRRPSGAPIPNPDHRPTSSRDTP